MMEFGIFLERSMPAYFQSPEDNSCGPQVIRMVADYFKKNKRRKTKNLEWGKIINITMKGNLNRAVGTRKKDLEMALKELGFYFTKLRGREENRLVMIMDALQYNHPVIVSCRITHKSKRYSHYSIIVGIDQDYIYFRDPFPYGGLKRRSNKKILMLDFLKKRSINNETVWGKDMWGLEVFVKGMKKRRDISVSSVKRSKKVLIQSLPQVNNIKKGEKKIFLDKLSEDFCYDIIQKAILNKYPGLEHTEWDFDCVQWPTERPFPKKIKIILEISDWGSLDPKSVMDSDYEFTQSDYPDIANEKTEEEEILEEVNPTESNKMFLIGYIDEEDDLPIVSAIEKVGFDWQPYEDDEV